MLFADRTFYRGLDMKTELRDLKYLVIVSTESDGPVASKIEEQFDVVEKSLEMILNDARRRHYSKWPTDMLAVAIVVLGLIITLYASWRADTKKLMLRQAEQGSRGDGDKLPN